MAYGSFNTGGGASAYDLDRLAAGFISGCVSAPLTTADGVKIATENGAEIAAHYSRAGELRKIYEAIEALATDIIRGTVSVPMASSAGMGIANDSGTGIAAIRNLQEG